MKVPSVTILAQTVTGRRVSKSAIVQTFRRPAVHARSCGAAFTLIELLVVISIIAILAAISIPFGGAKIPRDILVWSFGPDGEDDRGGDDDITSW